MRRDQKSHKNDSNQVGSVAHGHHRLSAEVKNRMKAMGQEARHRPEYLVR